MSVRRLLRVQAMLCAVLVSCGGGVAGACEVGVELLITEFMALNNGTLVDEDASYEDWIEIQNPCQASVDLDGWYLTDNPADLTKWRLPSVTLLRGEFVVVFASGKDRRVAGSELHTNFSLAAAGEYLALVKPDGTTIQHEFAPGYPPQYGDVSFGLDQEYTRFVSAGDAAAYRVPTIADSGLSTVWMSAGFDSSSWPSGPTGFGFTTGGSGSFDVTLYEANVSVPTLATAEAVISDPITHAEVHTDTAALINYRNTGGAGHFSADAPFPGTVMDQDVNDYVTRITGTILIPTAGPWTFGVNSDDGFGLELTRDPAVFNSSFPGPRGASDTLAVFEIPEPGAYAVRLVQFDRGGGSSLEFFAAEGSHASFSSSFQLVGDTAAGGLALGSIASLIGTDVSNEMHGVNSTLWSRVEFEVPDPSLLDLLDLDMTYEDGFVAHLNGTEVARANATDPVTWDSSATSDRPEEDAGIAQRFDLTESRSLLQPGTNLLAVQGLNDSVSDGDFLIGYELNAARETSSAAAPSYFNLPSPGSYNAAGYPGVAGPPSFSHPNGAYTDPFSLMILATEPGAVIRFTLDGSEPSDSNGTTYTVPIQIDASQRVRARVLVPGLAPGPVVTGLYSRLVGDALEFDSNLPIVIVDTFGGSLNASFLTEALTTVVPQVGERVAITDPAEFSGLSGIRWRGSSSLGFPKKQFFLEVWDEYRADLDVSLLGMPSDSDWILYGPYSDKALMRNVLAYRWSSDIGRYAVRTRFVEVFLKTGTGSLDESDYAGLYVLTEKIKRHPDRVPITKLESVDGAPPEITGGYLIKKDRRDPGDAGFTTASGQVLAYVDPKEEEITPAQAAYIKGYLDEFEAVLAGPDFADPVIGYPAYIDVDSFIDHHILVEMTKNIDGFRLSTFMFKDRSGKLTMGPIWDYNLSLGNANYLQGWIPTGWYGDLLGGSNYPWWDGLFADEAFRLRYADRWFSLRRGAFRTELLLQTITENAALIDEAQERNFTRWPVLGTYIWPNWYIASTHAEEIAWMKQWLIDRLEWMDGTYFEPPTFNHPAGEVPTGSNLTITASVGTAYYTTDGSDPRLPDGQPSLTAAAYSAPLVLISPVQVKARTFDGSDWSALNEATYYPLPIAMVNELLADNQSVHLDEQGEYEAWIELYNPFSTAVELGGLFLTDDLGDLEKWEIPAGTTLCSGLRLLIWMDGEPGEGPLHAGFTLAPSGGTIWLVDQTGYIVDSTTYPALAPDVSYGRRPDGGEQFDEFPYPTPLAPNPGVETPVIVNEFNAVAPDKLLKGGGSDTFWGQVQGNGGDWFELVVTADHADLRGFELVVEDDGGASAVTLVLTDDPLFADLRSGTIITVSSLLSTDVSYAPQSGDWWINLRAGAAGDGLYISNLDFSVSNNDTRITILDESGAIVFGPAGEGVQPLSGVGSDEVFKLENDPGPFTTPYAGYNDGTTSTFGAPNRWSAGAAEQEFGALRSVVEIQCAGDGECDDGNTCTDDICFGGICTFVANSLACDDGNPCTANDVCGAAVCRGEIVESCCLEDCECDDGDECTEDQCLSNTCVIQPTPTGSSCEDGDPCSLDDFCDQGLCQPGAPSDCSGEDGVCTVGTCDPLSGACQALAAYEGEACDDGDLCNDAKTCGAGVCSGGTPVDCSTLDDDCHAGVCDPATGCEAQPANDGGPCDDGDLCTEGATCLAGMCGEPVDCTTFDDECNVGVCDGPTGQCGSLQREDGLTCDDADACTTNDTCQAGACSGGPMTDCDDGNPCTDDSCDPTLGCLHTAVADATACDDGDLCTEDDACSAGVCAGDGLDCSSLDEVCASGVCDPETGDCGVQSANEGGACDDLDLCTDSDVCTSGECSGQPLDCSGEDDVCHVGVCDALSGTCETQTLSDGTSCDDGDACTEDTECTGGTCGAGTAVLCDDANSCTVDSCDAIDGCLFTPDDDQDGDLEPDSCDDGDACSVDDRCDGGVCSGVAMDCSGLDGPCVVGVCDGGSGSCEAIALTAGTPCSDGDTCTVADSCDSGLCVGGDPVDCDDANPCTLDACDPVSGCDSTPDTGASCDDGNPCTGADSCDATGDCVGSAVSDGTACDDLNSCTEDDGCVAAECTGTLVDCSGAGDSCSVGICNPSTGGCDVTPINDGGACDDGDACTELDQCDSGICAGQVLDCSSLDGSCVIGVCNGSTGQCETQPVLDGQLCDDGALCTESDQCEAGVCGGTAVDCSGVDDACNLGMCDPETGMCLAEPANEGAACNDSDVCTADDVCVSGACAGEALDCSSLDTECSAGVCSPGSGACVQQAINEGLVCDDGAACTEDDRCFGGNCTGTAIDCSGLDGPCVVGTCEPFSGTCETEVSGLCGIGGAVTYYRNSSGAGSEPGDAPVPGVEIDVDDDDLADAVTDGSGTYDTLGRAGSFSVTPMARLGDGEPAAWNDAITSFDSTFIAQHAVQIIELSPNQQIAADVSGNGSITAFDAALTAQLAVRLVEHLPVASSVGSDWAFFRCDTYAGEQDQTCTSPLYVHDPLTGAVADDFHALLYGDVTGNWVPQGGTPAGGAVSERTPTAPPAGPLSLQATAEAMEIGTSEARMVEIDRRRGIELRSRIGTLDRSRLTRQTPARLSVDGGREALASGERRELTIALDDADGVVALDLSLQYDPARLEVVSVRTAARTADYAVVRHGLASSHAIGLYGIVPLRGSGAVLVVTIEAIQDLRERLPLRLSAVANEGRIPIVSGSARTGTGPGPTSPTDVPRTKTGRGAAKSRGGI